MASLIESEVFPEEQPADVVLILLPEASTNGLAQVIQLHRAGSVVEEAVTTPLDSDDEEPGVVLPNDLFDEISSGEDSEDEETVSDPVREIRDQTDPLRADALDQLFYNLGERKLLTHKQVVLLAKTIERGLEAQKQLDKLLESGSDSITREGIVNLQDLIDAGGQARATMIESNLGLVIDIAKAYQNTDVDFKDLIGEGILGLITAVEKFDWRRGYKFSTVATWWIRQAIQRSLNGKWRDMYVGHDTAEHVKQLKKTYDFIPRLDRDEASGRKSPHKPTPDEIVKYSGLTREEVDEALKAHNVRVVSIDRPISDEDAGGDTMHVIVPDTAAEDPAKVIIGQLNADQLARSLANLQPVQQDIIKSSVWWGGVRPEPLKIIGERHGITEAKAAKLRDEALKRLASDPDLRRVTLDEDYEKDPTVTIEILNRQGEDKKETKRREKKQRKRAERLKQAQALN